jgi:hypothetical protein
VVIRRTLALALLLGVALGSASAADPGQMYKTTCRPDDPDSPDLTSSQRPSPASLQTRQSAVMTVQIGAALWCRSIAWRVRRPALPKKRS